MTNEGSNLRDLARRWSKNKSIKPGVYNCLMTIADRIDAETVELPRGNDGRPIHVDDTLYDSDGTQWTVVHIYYYSPDDGPDVVAQHGNAEINFEPPDYHGMTHERPDSWKKLERDIYHLVMSEYLDNPEKNVKDVIRRARALAEPREEDANGTD